MKEVVEDFKNLESEEKKKQAEIEDEIDRKKSIDFLNYDTDLESLYKVVESIPEHPIEANKPDIYNNDELFKSVAEIPKMVSDQEKQLAINEATSRLSHHVQCSSC